MAVKKIGTLNKHENPATNENEFDIENYMNANWDKIKEVVDNNADELSETQANKVDKVNGKGLSTEDYTTAEKQKLAGLNNYDDTEIKQDISDIKEEQQTQNNNIKNLQKNDAQQDKSIEALQKENTELKEECSRLRQDLNALPSGQAEGEYITLNDSADSRFNKLVIGGNSKQDTRSGKNLCDNNFKNYTIDNYGYKKIIDSEENLIASLIDKDTSVDLTGIYFGFTHTGKDAIEGMVWLINNGVETADKTNQGIHQYISFYPANEETFNKIFARYDIQVEKGTTATDYEPYGASPSSEYPSLIINVGDNINEIICNKNLINWDKVIEDSKDVSKTDDGYIKFYQGGNRLIIKDIFKENTQYVFTITAKKDIANSSVSLNFIYTDGSSSSANVSCQNANTDYKQTVVSEKGKTVDLIRSHYSDGRVSYLKIERTQLEEGTQATDYVSHQEQVVTFPLAENQKLYKGDYLAKDGIHHVRKQIELDGTENWQYRNTNSKGISTFSLSIVEPDYKRYDGFQAICSHFKNLGIVSAVSAMYDNDEGFSFFYNADYLASKSFYINTSQQSNLANFKNWLVQQKEAGTPVILEYELAEEEIEAYTPEQQEAYNKIVQTAKSYKNVTNIFSTDTVSPIASVNYRKDIETMLEQVQAQTNAINELLSTTKTSATLLDNLQSDLESEVM